VKAFQQHPLSAVFPLLEPEEFRELCEDIKAVGLRRKLVLYESMILDGWNRYRACKETGVPIQTEVYRGMDPEAFVRSMNLRRRHMNAGQRAQAIWKLAKLAYKPNGGRELPAVATVAARAGTSMRTAEYAKRVEADGAKPVRDAVRDGQLSVERAATIAGLPKPDQRQALTEALSEYETEPAAAAGSSKPERSTVPWKEHQATLTELLQARDSLEVFSRQAETAQALLGTDAAKEMLRLRGDLRTCQRRRDELLNQNAELRKQVAYWKRMAKKGDNTSPSPQPLRGKA